MSKNHYKRKEVLNDSKVIRTHNPLVCKRTLSHLGKLASLAKLTGQFSQIDQRFSQI